MKKKNDGKILHSERKLNSRFGFVFANFTSTRSTGQMGPFHPNVEWQNMGLWVGIEKRILSYLQADSWAFTSSEVTPYELIHNGDIWLQARRKTRPYFFQMTLFLLKRARTFWSAHVRRNTCYKTVLQWPPPFRFVVQSATTAKKFSHNEHQTIKLFDFILISAVDTLIFIFYSY